MSHQRDRDEFIALMTREGVPVDVARLVMRHGATLQRLAEAQCNGDWPSDNGERRVEECQACESLWVPSVLKRVGYITEGPGGRTYYRKECPNCRVARRLTTLLAPYRILPIFQGDPRGAVVKLRVPSGVTNDWGKEGVCVP